MKRTVTDFYYCIKPLLPRWFQVQLRSWFANRKLQRYANVWPIDPSAARPPDGWRGWPGKKAFALVLTHDVEGPRGLGRCMHVADLEEVAGFRSSFNFVAEGYMVPESLRVALEKRGFEIGVHGITHAGNMFRSRAFFKSQAPKINRYLKEWGAVGFRAPGMYHNLDWIRELDVEYDCSTFDTDPFEPQPDGLHTIFPVLVPRPSSDPFVELPYTLPQDFTLFVLLKHGNIDVWKRKADWIAEKGGMILLNSHPDYMCLQGSPGIDEYPIEHYCRLLDHIARRYSGRYWQPLPRELARFVLGQAESDSAWSEGAVTA